MKIDNRTIEYLEITYPPMPLVRSTTEIDPAILAPVVEYETALHEVTDATLGIVGLNRRTCILVRSRHDGERILELAERSFPGDDGPPRLTSVVGRLVDQQIEWSDILVCGTYTRSTPTPTEGRQLMILGFPGNPLLRNLEE